MRGTSGEKGKRKQTVCSECRVDSVQAGNVVTAYEASDVYKAYQFEV